MVVRIPPVQEDEKLIGVMLLALPNGVIPEAMQTQQMGGQSAIA